MDMQTIIWTMLAPAAMLGVVMGARWLAARYRENALLARAFTFVDLMADRARDKYLAELKAAKQPESDGGVIVTAAELSALRANAWKGALAEAPAAIRDTLANEIGAEQGKAIIGAKLPEPGAAPVMAQV